MAGHGTTKLKIFEKSLDLFSRKGYNATSMDDIATAVGIKKATLYSHVSGKEMIFTEIFKQILEEYITFVTIHTKNDESISAREQLFYIFTKYTMYNGNSAKMKFWDRFYYFPPEHFQEYIYEKTEETLKYLVTRIAAIFERGVSTGEFKCKNSMDSALAYYYLLIGFVMSRSYYNTRNIEDDIYNCLTAFLEGIQ
jgi:AcrR family transcriptional regulator